MIVVNNPGSWGSMFPFLRHAKWDGCTIADLVFPFFLFVMGVSIFVSMKNRPGGWILFRKILIRSGILFALGLSLHLFPEFNLSTVRIPGVLQRIALVYFFSSLAFIYIPLRYLVFVFVGILLTYHGLMLHFPSPDTGNISLEPDRNLAAWLDRTLLSGHLWAQTKTWDPEGVLTTLPAIATGISGIFAGSILFSENKFSTLGRNSISNGIIFLFLLIVFLLCAGFWSQIFPINKSLWSPSYVLLTSGLGMILLWIFYWITDLHGKTLVFTPFMDFGKNALFIYAGSGFLSKILGLAKYSNSKGEVVYFRQKLYSFFLHPQISAELSSLLWSLFFLFFFWLIAVFMRKKNIFIKI